MKFPFLTLLCLLIKAVFAVGSEPALTSPAPPFSKFPDATIAFGVAKPEGRVGITKPKAAYRLHRPIDIAVYFDHAPWRYDPAADRSKFEVMFGPSGVPLNFPGPAQVLLTFPDGSIEEFPADTRIDILGPPEMIWDSPSGIHIGYQLDRLIRKPGVYELQFKIGYLESPVVSFRMVRHLPDQPLRRTAGRRPV